MLSICLGCFARQCQHISIAPLRQNRRSASNSAALALWHAGRHSGRVLHPVPPIPPPPSRTPLCPPLGRPHPYFPLPLTYPRPSPRDHASPLPLPSSVNSLNSLPFPSLPHTSPLPSHRPQSSSPFAVTYFPSLADRMPHHTMFAALIRPGCCAQTLRCHVVGGISGKGVDGKSGWGGVNMGVRGCVCGMMRRKGSRWDEMFVDQRGGT